MTACCSCTAGPQLPRLMAVLLTSTMLSGVPQAMAQTPPQLLPTGGSVAAGGATIGTPNNGALTVMQSSSSAVVNWQSFSVGQGNAVNFVQPSSTSAILNRVTGAATSTIAGQINANGQVYLVNPNGIAITRSGTVNVGGGFVASTLGMSDADFMSGKRTFTGNGASASVSNAGSITIGRGGYAALLGGAVDNAGTITVPLGKVGLGSGERATLDLAGDGFMQVAVPTKAAGTQALVSNSGTISANGGTVQLSAATARDMARQAINMSGTIAAKSVGGRNGAIVLGGTQGTVAVSGKMLASSRNSTGGRITVTGRDIKLASATLDASGKTGGGTITIGGNYQGHGPLQRADTVSIDRATAIKADALSTGNGGNVVVWSDLLTTFAGTISARGGAVSGHGGDAEVSGKAKLAFTGFANLSATNGRFGTLLLDPFNVTISNGAQTTGAGFTANGDDSVINATTLSTQLEFASVTVTTGVSGTQQGNITVAAPLSWSTPTTLTLIAANAIAINAPINVNGPGGVALIYNTASPTNLSFNNGASIDYGAVNRGGTLSINSQAYTLVYSMTGLANISATGSSALATSLNSTTTFSASIVASNRYSGTFEGLGHTISNLTIANTTGGAVGLFGFVSDGTIRDIGLVGGSITAPQRSIVGALIGQLGPGSRPASVVNAYSTANVTGGDAATVGGLIGSIFASGADVLVVNSHSAGNVTTGAQTAQAAFAGGLVGSQTASGGNTTISGSYATGTVTGGSDAILGGLVASMDSGRIGGVRTAAIINSYATGAILGSNANVVGGLVGNNTTNAGISSISGSFATGEVTGGVRSSGGLVGANSSNGTSLGRASITDSYATGAVTGRGGGTVGGLVGINSGVNTGGLATIATSYATGRVTTSGFGGTGGLIGFNQSIIGGTATVTASYWDTTTSGIPAAGIGNDPNGQSVNVTGLTTAPFQSGTLPTNFSSAVWGTGTGLYPYLKGIFATAPQVVSGFVYRDAGATGLSSGTSGAVTVNVVSGGSAFGSATAGANGYYYAFGQPASIANGTSVIASTTTNAATGASNAARIATSTYTPGTPLQSGLDIWGPVTLLAATTTATTYSGALTGGFSLATLPTLPTGNAIPSFLTGAMPTLAAMGAGFAIDTPLAISNRFAIQTTAASAAITVSSPITVASGGGVGLFATGALAVNAPITVNGAGNVSLAAGSDTTTVAGASLLKLSFGNGAGLTYANADGSAATSSQGGTLAINGQAYTLLYNLAQPGSQGPNNNIDGVAGIDLNSAAGGSAGFYALATDLTGTGTAANPQFVRPLVGTLAGAFTGVFDGLGHTITNLTMAATGGFDLALFEQNAGTIRNVGLVGGSISNGGGRTAPLVAWNITKGIVANAYSSATVSSGGDTGGLVGRSQGFDSTDVVAIVNSFATGAVTGTADFANAGGLVGKVDVANGTSVVVNSSASGAVTQQSQSGFAGGLVGVLDGRASIQQSYSTGAVSGLNSANIGGLIGLSQGSTVSRSYWNTQTSGQPAGIGNDIGLTSDVTGLTTAPLQTATAATNLGSAFAGGAGLYPYLASFFPNGVQVVSGFAYQDGGVTPLASGTNGAATVSIAGNGRTLSSVTTGANGYYYAFLPNGTLVGPSGVAAYTQANIATGAKDAVSYVSGTPGQATSNLDLSGGWRRDKTLASSLSSLDADFATTTNGAPVAGFTLPNRAISAFNNFVLDSVLSVTGTLTLASPSNVTQTAAFSAGSLILEGSNANSLTLTNTGNQFGRFAASGGAIDVFDANSLTISATIANACICVVTGVSATGTVRIATAGDLTIAAGASVSGHSPALSAGGAFINNAGAGAVVARTGNWLVYSSDSTGNTFGGLNSGNTAIWGTAAGGTVTATGNRYVFATGRTLTVTTQNDSKTYGDDITNRVATDHAITGFDRGVAGAYLADTASTGTARVTSSGAAATANVTGSPYAITASLGSLASASGYGFTFVNAGALTVNRRGISVTADAASKTYGDVNPTLTFTANGLVNNDTLTGSLATTAGQFSNVGGYGITQGTLANSNYALTYTAANLTVSQRALTVAANAASKTYGDVNPTLTFSANGLVNNDTLTGSLATTAGQFSNVGGYGITQGSLANSNYALTYTAANLTVNQRALTVAANAASKTYGDVNPTLTFSANGLVNNDTLTGSLATMTGQFSNVGAYAIGQGSVAASNNYALTYVGANLTVTQRALTVTADAASKTYGDVNPILTFTANGLVNNDTLTGSISTTAGQFSNVGAYAIGQGSVAATNNYALTYVGANLTVTQRALTVTANAASKTYGDLNQTLTFTANGLVNNDTLSGALTTTAGQFSRVGSYGITIGSLANSNYALTYTAANLTVTQRALTVTANAASKTYGDVNPTLTFTANGLVNNDTLTGSLATTAGQFSNVGAYAIGQGSVASSNNYALTYVGANLTVTQRALTVTANAASKSYGDVNPTLTFTANGLVNNDTVTGSLATTAGLFSNVGTYAIGQGSVASSNNYALTYVGANLTVTQRALTVTANALSKTYGDVNPTLTFTANGLVNNDTLTGSLATTAGQVSNVGAYAIGQGSVASSNNYALTYVGANLTVTQRALTVTANAASKTYGDLNPPLTFTANGLVNNDTLTGSLTTTAGQFSNVGAYAIGQGTVAASSNYAISYTGANLTVRQRAITVAADSLGRRYGLVNGDLLTGSLTTEADNSSPVGSYAIARGSLSASANYTMTFVPGVLSIDAVIDPPTSDVASTRANSAPSGMSVPAALPPVTFPPPSGNGSDSIVLSADPRFDGVVVCTTFNCVVASTETRP